MTETIATEPSRTQAVAEVRSVKKPSQMSRTQWRSVRRVLMVVAKHYPKAIPSVATIGAEAKLSARQVQRILAIAEAAGMLVVEHDAGTGRHRISKTSRYHIATLIPDVRGDISGEEMSDQGTPSESLLPSVVGTHSGSPHFVRPQSAAMSREAERIIREGEARVVRDRGRLRTEKPVFQTKVRKNDAQVLVEYFLVEWENLLAKKPLLAASKPIDRKGEAQGYIWHQFLRPEYGPEYSSQQVLEMIDAFFLDLASGRVGLKQRQSAWKAFTVHWQPPKVKTTREKGSLRARNK